MNEVAKTRIKAVIREKAQKMKRREEDDTKERIKKKQIKE